MAGNTSNIGEDYSQHEPLTTRLHGLVHDYPEGVGIFKELIQNADDAGAKSIEFVLDWRTHELGRLGHSSLSRLAGPAMLVFNDATFSDDDFEGLKNLGQGGKKTNLRKTGRFGLGFNSVYNMTDHPGFISREYICLFDPHGSAVPGTNPQSHGRRWKLSAFPDPVFLEVFHSAGFEMGANSLQGTLFRFPFRTNEQAQCSEICSTPFTRDKNVEPLLEGLLEMGEELLLFLKAIQELKVREIEADGSEKVHFHIKTLNPEVVAKERDTILRVLEQQQQASLIEICRTQADSLPSVSYQHEIQTIAGTNKNSSTWRVVNLLKVDDDSSMTDVMAKLNAIKEKAVPWGGAAARIHSDSKEPVKGKQYCFLPLPELTGLPIHINGYFDLNSSRKGSTGDETSGSAEARSEWNKFLVKHVVAPACALLIRDLVSDLKDQPPEVLYAMWPIGVTQTGLLNELPVAFVKALQKYPVLHSNLQEPWVRPQSIKLLDAKAETLFEPLTVDAVCLPTPKLPVPIIEAFKKAQLPLQEITPEWIRNYVRQVPTGLDEPLSKAPRASLQKYEWIEALLKYCLADGHKNLRGLPLALLANGRLVSFGHAPSRQIFLANDLQREIFSHHPDWFLDKRLQNAITSLSSSENGVTQMTDSLFVERLAELECWTGEAPQPWEPSGDTLPNAEWLGKIYQYFATVTQLPSKLDEVNLPLVPGNDNQLYCGGYASTPLWAQSSPTPKRQNTFAYFGIKLIPSDDYWRPIFRSFFDQHPLSNPAKGEAGNGFIWPLMGADLIDMLHLERKQLPSYNTVFYKELLDYLSGDFSRLTDTAKNKLKELAIFPVLNSDTLTALDQPSVYLPAAIPPDIPLNVTLLHKEERWKYLFQSLGIRALSLSRLILEILPNYETLSPKDQFKALEWIRSQLPNAIDELRRSGENYQTLRQKVGASQLIRCADGKLRSAHATYRPGEKIVLEVLGDEAPLPDMQGIYNKDQVLWLEFFDRLGIQRDPQPQDLLTHIEKLQQKCREQGIDAVAESCKTLLYYVEDHWDYLKSKRVRVAQSEIPLIDALRNKAWLPIETNNTELKKYPGALSLRNQQRLHRPEEVLYVQDANLAASQRPLIRLRRRPKPELGFKTVRLEEVVKHFAYLLKIWNENPNSVSEQDFKRAIKRVYQYFVESLIRGNVDRSARERFKNFYSKQECLWDGKGKFWKPSHVFEVKVLYFGDRRIGLGEHDYVAVYRLLGQRPQPKLDDYLDFIKEVQSDYSEQSLPEDEATNVVQVLNRIAKCADSGIETKVSQGYLLTENLALLPPKQVLVPDAPWYVKDVRKLGVAELLHPEVDRHLADIAGCPSLLKNVRERTSGDRISLCSEASAREQAKTWQKHLQSNEFRRGLERLVRDEGVIEDAVKFDVGWLKTVQVKAAEEILTDLFWGSRKIASQVEGDAHFDQTQGTIYVRHNKEVGVDYLAECLNKELAYREWTLSDKSKLIRIIDANPKNISGLLDSLRVRSLQTSVAPEDDEDETAESPDFGVDSDPSYEGINGHTVTGKSSSENEGSTPQTPSESISSHTKTDIPNEPSTSQNQPSRQRRGGILNIPTSRQTNGADEAEDEIGDGEDWDTSSVSGNSLVSENTHPSKSNQGTSGRRSDFSGNGHSPNNGRGNSTRRTHSDANLSSNGKSTQSNGRSSNNGRGGSSNGRGRSTGGRQNGIPSSSNGSSPNGAGQRGKWKTCVYTSPQENSERDPERLTQATRSRVDKAGMDRVLAYEQDCGRDAEPMYGNNPGYDIESIDDDGFLRYIEVKSFQEAWPGSGAKVSKAQFSKAQEEGDNFWLYVVEYAEDDRNYEVHCIQNPANQTKEFYFDEGWKELAKSSADERKPARVDVM